MNVVSDSNRMLFFNSRIRSLRAAQCLVNAIISFSFLEGGLSFVLKVVYDVCEGG